jgi:hypothetical protein
MNDCSGTLYTTAEARANTQAIINQVKLASPDTTFVLMTMNPIVGSGTGRDDVQTYYNIYKTMVTDDPTLKLVDNTPSWAGATLTQIPDGIHPKLSEVEARLIPDIAAVISPLIG